MSTNGFPNILSGVAEDLHELRRNWGWFLVLGIALIILGVCAIGSAFSATLATVMTFGILVLVGGCVEIVSSFWARHWGGLFLHVLAGILYAVIGFLMVTRPLAAAAGLTLMLAALFFVGGMFRIIAALSHRFPGWGWVLLNGVVTLILGVMIWREWPEATFWVIGMFLGIDLVFAGVSWVMLGLSVRNIPAPAATSGKLPGQPVGV
jgi:uncharacterized membrane protein HdeD (DUF308 family)